MSFKKHQLIEVVSIFFASLFLLKPTCIPYIMGSTVDKIYTICMLCVCAIVIILYIYRRKLSNIIFLIAIYYLYQIIVTACLGGDLRSIVMTSVQFSSLCLLAEICITKNKIQYINIMTFIMEIYIYINFITIIVFPEGMYRTISTNNQYNWFLGYKNQLINFMLPALMFSIINYYYTSKKKNMLKNKVRMIALFICCIATAVIQWSAATLVIIFIMCMYVLLRKALSTKIFNFKTYLLTNIILTFSIVVLRIQNLFSFIIVDILNKDITLTGRVYIWDKVMYYISQNFVLGYGVEDYSYRLLKMQFGNIYWLSNYAALHAHCRFLEVFYRGGIILLAIYVLILILTSKKLVSNKDTIFSMILSVSLFAYLTGMMTEWYDYSPLFFVMIVMAYYSDSFSDENLKLKKGKSS